jgi:hypothetical protein
MAVLTDSAPAFVVATETPETAEDMIAYIEGQADPEGRYKADLAAKQAEYARAQAQYEAARRALTEHELTTPDADPVAWANKKRELSDALPVWGEIANERRRWVEASARNLAQARWQVVQDLQFQLKTRTDRAWATVYEEKQALQRKIEALQRGDHDAIRKVKRQYTALSAAMREFGIQ